MREILARTVCLLAVLLVVALAHAFARRHNPPEAVIATATPARVEPPPTPPAADQVRGREVYQEQNCSSCHAIAGEGNPRNPLDGVGARRERAELASWITGTGAAAEDLAPSVVRRKQRFQALSPADLDALVSYLAGLTATP